MTGRPALRGPGAAQNPPTEGRPGLGGRLCSGSRGKEEGDVRRSLYGGVVLIGGVVIIAGVVLAFVALALTLALNQ